MTKTAAVTAFRSHTPDTVKVQNLPQSFQDVTPPKIEISRDRSLCWEQVNEVTWKLTDGDQIRVPAAHGKWGGFNTTRALAWVTQIFDPITGDWSDWKAR